MELLLNKYKPKTLNDIKGQDASLRRLKNLVVNFSKGKKAILIYGPPGIGKTISVYVLATDLDYEIIELNASDIRNKDAIENLLRNSVKQKSLFKRGKLIFLDEIEGISGSEDRGGLQALLRLIEETNFPIILATNEIDIEKFDSLKKKAELLEFTKLDEDTIFNVLKEICTKEKVNYDKSILVDLANNCNGDLRAAIIDLQTLIDYDKNTLSNLEYVYRFKRDNLNNILIKLFGNNLKVAIESLNNNDIDLVDLSKKNIGFVIFSNENALIYWIDENLARFYQTDNLKKAFLYLSKADIYRGRITRTQYYGYLIYIKNLIAAISTLTSKNKELRFNKTIRSPKQNKKLWYLVSKKRKLVAERLASINHCSVNKVVEDMPYYNIILDKNPNILESIGLDKENV